MRLYRLFLDMPRSGPETASIAAVLGRVDRSRQWQESLGKLGGQRRRPVCGGKTGGVGYFVLLYRALRTFKIEDSQCSNGR